MTDAPLHSAGAPRGRTIAAFAVVIALAFAARFGLRVAYFMLTGGEYYGSSITMFTNADSFGLLFGGVLATIFKPRVSLIVCGVLAALGMLLIAGRSNAEAGVVVLGLGGGGVRVCAYALAVLLPPTINWRVGAVVAVTAASAFASRAASGVVESMFQRGPPTDVIVVSAILVVLLAVAAAVLLVREKFDAPPPPRGRQPAVLAACAIGLSGILFALGTPRGAAPFNGWLGVVLLIGVASAWPMVGRDLSKAIGALFVLAALAVFVGIPNLFFTAVIASWMTAVALVAFPLMLARALLFQNQRIVALVAAFIIAAETGPIHREMLPPGVTWLASLVLAGVGGLFIAFGGRLDASVDSDAAAR